jgi:hypothetical protein
MHDGQPRVTHTKNVRTDVLHSSEFSVIPGNRATQHHERLEAGILLDSLHYRGHEAPKFIDTAEPMSENSIQFVTLHVPLSSFWII